MANADRGEQTITVDGQTFTLKLSMRAARQLQKRNKKTIGELLLAAERLDYDAVGEMMFGLLQEYHGKDFPTMAEVDALIDRSGGPNIFYEYCEKQRIAEEMAKAAKAPGVEGAGENPPQAQAGTGDSSALRLAASA